MKSVLGIFASVFPQGASQSKSLEFSDTLLKGCQGICYCSTRHLADAATALRQCDFYAIAWGVMRGDAQRAQRDSTN